MPDLYSGKNFAMDLAGTVVGILSKKDMMLGKSIKSGDVIIGSKVVGFILMATHLQEACYYRNTN